MKIRYLALFVIVGFSAICQGQVAVDIPRISPPKPLLTSQPLPDPSFWLSTPIEWSSSQREFPQSITNIQTGEVTLQNRSVIEVGNGLNYIDSNNAWQQSQDLIELTPDGGAAALLLPNKAFFGPNLSSTNGIKLITMSNLVFTTYPVGVYIYDPTTGKEELLARLQDGVAGKFLPPNRIIYPGAFQSGVLQADLRITVTKGAMECDTIITHQPKVSPQTFSMDPGNTLLQVRHVWSTPILPTLAAGQPAVSGVRDSRIDFGDFRFVRGRAFAWDGTAATDANAPAQIDLVNATLDEPVGKAWQNGSPSMLTESVLWSDVQAKLAQLPLMAKAGKSESKRSKQIELASSSERLTPGFVLDYTIVTGTGNYPFNTYYGTNTYWLQSSATFGGIVTFNAGCIIKRAPGATLTASGSAINDLVCNGTSSQPSIITVQDDNMYGEITGTNCAAADSATAFVSAVRGANVTGMNIRYAGEGIEFLGECCTDNRTFKDSTIESCLTGAFANACNVTISNSAISCVTTPESTYNSGSFSGSWGSTFNQVSLHGVVVAGMQTLLSGKTPSSTTLNLYNYSGNYPTNFPISYNTKCWIYGLKGLTSICVSNGGENPYWNQDGSVLITSKHVLTAAHIDFTPGLVMRFIGKSGTHYIGVVTNSTVIKYAYYGDLAVLTLSNDLPSDVEIMRILPYETVNKMTFDIMSGNVTPNSCLSRYLPCIGINQQKGAYVEDLWFWDDPNNNVNWMRGSAWFPSWINGYEPGGGDSGHPVMAVINNELVLVGNWSVAALPGQSGGPETLSTSALNTYNSWFGFRFSTTNTLVVSSVARWNLNSYPCNQSHTLAFFNSDGINLGSINVTAVQSNYFWSSGGTLTNGGYPGSVLTLPGAPNTNYYLLSQEFYGGDHWYSWPGTTVFTNASDFINTGAASSANLSSFYVYPNSAGYTFGPLALTYYVYPQLGGTSLPGSNTNGINQCLSTNGGTQYTVSVFDISGFPNHIR